MSSFASDASSTVVGPRGQRVHHQHLQHSARLQRQLYEVKPGVWSLVGNGLSNQTFIEGPQGLIAIDTGESNEEMAAALAEVRQHTQAPLVAVIYTHFHYVFGTRAVFADAGRELPVFGHARIAVNLARVTSEITPAYTRGVIHQFGLALPAEGPDGLVNVGLGLRFRNPEHAPFTNGHVPVTHNLQDGERLTIAGLTVEVRHAPSDADDSITLWFPELSVCVHNIVWPALFNIFAIRGESYRDPQILLSGIDDILALEPEHLIGAHAEPLSGRKDILTRVQRYRDSIQFLWDQTVRGLNRGLSSEQLAHRIRLPDLYSEDYLTTELYGVAEHHVRQIASGLCGWFDGDTAKLFPLEPGERAARLIAGFGGKEQVQQQAVTALHANDLRWALELASWLVADAELEGGEAERQLVADVLREIAYRSSAANIRNWCLTRARHLEGSADLAAFKLPVQGGSNARDALRILRVRLDPAKAEGVDAHLAFELTDAPRVGLHIRNAVAVVTDGSQADTSLTLSTPDLLALLAGQLQLESALASGAIVLHGELALVQRVLGVFDAP